jgi:hypothetical protein
MHAGHSGEQDHVAQSGSLGAISPPWRQGFNRPDTTVSERLTSYTESLQTQMDTGAWFEKASVSRIWPYAVTWWGARDAPAANHSVQGVSQ